MANDTSILNRDLSKYYPLMKKVTGITALVFSTLYVGLCALNASGIRMPVFGSAFGVFGPKTLDIFITALFIRSFIIPLDKEEEITASAPASYDTLQPVEKQAMQNKYTENRDLLMFVLYPMMIVSIFAAGAFVAYVSLVMKVTIGFDPWQVLGVWIFICLFMSQLWQRYYDTTSGFVLSEPIGRTRTAVFYCIAAAVFAVEWLFPPMIFTPYLSVLPLLFLWAWDIFGLVGRVLAMR